MKILCKRTISLLLVLVMLLGMVPAAVLAADADAEEIINIDFKQMAKDASEQPWWDDLATVTTANGYETKRVGNVVRGTAMSDTEREAYGQLRTWMDETYGWTINENASYFDYASGGNRLYLCADDNVAWGASLNTYYRDYALAIDVDVETAGVYDLTMVTSKVVKASQDFPVDGWENTNSGTVDVLINGELVLDEYNFEGSGTDLVKMSKVKLLSGKNTITFLSSLNYAGLTTATPCWHFNLCSLTAKLRQSSGGSGIDINFKEVAKAAEEQSFWNDFETVATANGYDTKRVGNITRGTAMTDSQRAAYGDLRMWLDETYGWTINESKSYFDYASGGNRLYLCADDNVDWGASLNTYYRDYCLALDVDIPATGLYSLSMVTSKVIKASQDFPVDGWSNTQGGTVDVLVNGVVVYDEYNFEGSGIENVDMGAIFLEEGINTIEFLSSKNYAGLTTATPCWHFNLRSLTLAAMEAETINEQAIKTVKLPGAYVPADKVISAEIHTAQTEDAAVAVAFINDEGLLEIRGIGAGKTNILVYEAGEVLCSVAVEVIAVDSSEMQPITLDFKDFARQASQQSFWTRLPHVVNADTPFIGKVNNPDSMTADQVAAYNEMIDWGMETFGWTINESVSGFASYWKQLFLNGQDSIPWGMNMWTYYHGSSEPSRSKMAFTVNVEHAGWYGVDLSAFTMGSSWPGVSNTTDRSSGGDRIAVYVNGKEVYYDLSLVSGTSAYVPIDRHLGAAYFEAGENVIAVDSVFSYNDTGVGGRSNTPLIDMTLEPLKGVQVQEYLNASVPLKETYVPFDTQTGDFTLESSNDWIATASINANGVVTVTGVTTGKASIFVKRADEIVCVIPVTVTGFEGALDELQGSPAKLDFMAVMDRAVERDWWDALTDAGESGVKQITTEDTQALEWIEENTRWTVAETSGSVGFNGGEAAYGISVDGQLTLTTDIPAEGLYNVTVEYLAGGGTVDVSVNGEAVYEGLDTAGEAAVVKRSLGTVQLEKGANEIAFDGSVKLRSVTFTPLGAWQAEVGSKRYINLNETYLPFDEEVTSDYTVTTADASVATARFDNDGELVVSGVSVGQTVLSVSASSGVVCDLYVNVVEAGKLLELTYTIDDFKAETLQVGETAIGQLGGLTTMGTKLTEKQLYLEGSIYFLSSDPSVAKVDQTTGDVLCVSEGTATITAYALMGGETGKAVVTLTVVDETDLVSIDVTTPVDYVGVGNSMQLTVTGRKNSGAAANMAFYPVAYSIPEDQQAIATVTEDGRITGHSVGTVTVTATAGVMRMPVSDTIEVQVVENSELSGSDIKLQFDQARVLDVFEWTLERDGLELDVEGTANGGEGMFMDAMGMRHPSGKGEGVSFNFVVKKSDWYRTFMQGKQLTSTGGLCHCFVDNSYVGLMQGDAANSNEGAGGYMSTVYLEAGVHNVRVIAQESCQVMVGRIIFQPTQDPRTVDVALQAAATAMVVGQTTTITTALTDANGETFMALRQEVTPDYTNYYDITSSNEAVVTVSGDTLTAVGEGTVQITFTGELVGERVTEQLEILVTNGTIVRAELSAEETTFKPDAEPVQLTLTTYGLDGTAHESLPEGVSVSYTSSAPEAVQVDENGLVSFTGTEGTALVTAIVTENGKTVEATIWITSTLGKTEPTLYTYEERAAAQENALKYDWAWAMKESAVKQADYYVEHLDQIYDMWIPETFPRACQVGFKGDSNYRYCRYCGEDLVTNYHAYPWIVDPIENPWKIVCPACDREFPSNDFGAYYESGLGEDGKFHEELADKDLLTNDLYPEMGEGWGVDDGWGYEAADGSVHTYIAYYLACVFEGLYQNNYLTQIMNALRNAYLYTGDEKYGTAGAILTDRIADIYPDYDVYQYDWYSYSFVEAYSGRGKFIGLTWDAIIGKDLSRYVDTFWTAADNPEVVEYLRGKAHLKGMNPEDITPEYIRKNAEDGILLELFECAKCGWIQGNFGMSEAAVAYAAHTLNRLPESQEMIDWVFRTEVFTGSGRDYNVAGGDVMRTLVNYISRDGLGNEGSTTYNSLMEGNLLDVADALDGFDLVDGYDLWENQKFVNMYTGAMRMVTLGNLTPQIHEGGNPQQFGFTPSLGYMTTAFSKSGDREIARAIYAANGNSVNGLHADIFTKNPEAGLRSEIQKIVNEDGRWDLSASDMLSGYGIAMLREGPSVYLGKTNAHEFATYWMGFGYSDISHAQLETLHIDVEAFGLALSSSMGYPAIVASTDPMRMQWVMNTISHNTVVVDDKPQSPTDEAGFPLHFADDGKAKVIDIQDDKCYEEADIYRRTLVAVDNGDGVHYAVDFFRVLGGSEHVYSFHGATDLDAATTGLSLDHQPMGTYAGPEVPYGDGQKGGINFSDGYSWLDDVYRDSEPETTFSVDWAIKDFHNRLTTSAGIHLKLTMLSEEPMTEVALANGYPPERVENKNIDHLEYMLVRRSGEEGMDSLFTAVIEPYQLNSYIASSELVDVLLTDGTEGINDRAAAVKVTLKSGRVDYIIYATNADCTYLVDDKITFRGFAAVVSYENGVLTYAWGNDAIEVADAIEGALPALTGEVVDFTKGITMDGYTMTVQLDQTIAEEALTDQFVYVETDGVENGVYHIYGAEITGNTAVLDLKHQTLVREYIDVLDLDKGYKHNIAVGQKLRIPLSACYDLADLFTPVTDQIVKTGNKLNLTVGAAGSGVTYQAIGLPNGAKLNAQTGLLSWMPTSAQTGRYLVTIQAVRDGEVVGEMDVVIYAVNYTGSTFPAASCAHAKAVSFEVNGVIETVCPACGTITKTEPDDEIVKFDLAGANMTLGNELKLNFLVKAADLTDGEYTAKITHNGEVTEAVLARYNTSYQFVSYAVSAKQMADTISVVICDENGSEVSNVYETSVRAYAMNLLSNKTLGAKVKTLVVDMLNYGSEAQNYFSYNTEDLANSLLTDEQKALATAAVTCTNKQVKGLNFYGANLSLEDKILLNIFFKNVTEDMSAKITYKDYKGTAKSVTKELVQHSGNIYKVIIDEIVLADAFSPVTVTVYNADGSIHGSGTDSVESYIARTGNSALNDAIMKFAHSAKGYLAG